MSKNLSRREWLRRGLATGGALGLGAALPFSSLGYAQGETTDYIDYGNGLRELKLTPPSFSDLKAKLNANENPYGPSPKALEAFIKQASEGNYYSWPLLKDLMDKIADFEGVKTSNVMMGPGSSDLLEKTGLVSFMDGGNIVSGDPPYMSLVNVAKKMGGTWKPVKLTDDYEHDLKKMEAEIDDETKIVYITNPNNPTGTITDTKKLKKFCAKVSEKVLVFVDEAYLELADDGLDASMVSLVAEGKNVIVSRTFSKIHGMAGIRVGYMVGLEETLKDIQAITRGGMGISGPSIMAASASMDDTEFLTSTKAKIAEGRKFAVDMLTAKGFDVMPSQTNFIIFPIEMDGKDYMKKMYEQSVGIRVFNFWDTTWSRVSIATMDEMKLFASAFEKTIG
ncbi:histidinol-phosphate transaminase [Flammeovirgaceae bacterium SG7u.111]|nr:histidinol-phosphate transaminase [Flammeovirgaceae bacterium SG7u.132]WPO33056.1 histidinol-phosphate transaminase [Flammeovirgaceae bacterium SG7u.111]